MGDMVTELPGGAVDELELEPTHDVLFYDLLK